MISRISSERISSRSFRLESAELLRTLGVGTSTGTGFGAGIWSAFRIIFCTTSADNLLGYGCYATTGGIRISEWSGVPNSMGELGGCTGR